MCAFIMKNGNIMMCSSENVIPGHSSGSNVPIDISAEVNAGCDEGKKVTKIKGGIHRVFFFFGECSATKVFGTSIYGAPVCRSSASPGVVHEVMQTAKPIVDVSGSYTALVALERQ
eukprot:TRINITY_DN5910_c0_g1_i1.p1 TRINITY_DN5910_c0_g1~~TRINITY_DN5910_c0_g1_i1.p1  ORF type:complete len:134 (-),score=19.07 TRINITY_DN5910_c0_g1_i1:77-424(-)